MQVHLHNELNQEDNAMLQALYSRSPKSVTEHLAKLAKVGSGKFMEQFYVGYGHASIGDCGFVTLYFEGISMLAAKALEDDPLFNGQECSSRYIDFSEQPFINPFHSSSNTDKWWHAQRALNACRTFYNENLKPVQEHLRQRFPNENSCQDVAYDLAYEKAIRAKTFDILRGFLPAGATTNVAWTTSLRKAHERLVLMMHHPLPEIRDLAAKAYGTLYEAYPHSFKKGYAEAADSTNLISSLRVLESEEIYGGLSDSYNFYAVGPFLNCASVTLKGHRELPFEVTCLDQTIDLTTNRPARANLPRHVAQSHVPFKIRLTVDFGSFRDLQRHRGGYCSNPVLCGENGFHAWYVDQLPDAARGPATSLLRDIAAASEVIRGPSPADSPDLLNKTLLLQYIQPMGVLVPVTLVYSLAQCVYVAELRSGKTVHPTLRVPAQRLAQYLADRGVQIHADMDESDWTPRRGTQDIVFK